MNPAAQIEGLLSSNSLSQIIINSDYSMILVSINDTEFDELGRIEFKKLELTLKPRLLRIKIDDFEEKDVKF